MLHKKYKLCIILTLILISSSLPTFAQIKTDLMAQPDIILKEDFNPKAASVNGIKIGDKKSSIIEALIDYRSKGLGFIFMKDGSRYYTENGLVKAIGLPGEKLAALNVKKISDIKKIFKNHDDKSVINIGGKAVITQYYFKTKKLTLNWNNKDEKISHIFIGEKIINK